MKIIRQIVHSNKYLTLIGKRVKSYLHVMKNHDNYLNHAAELELPHVSVDNRNNAEEMFLYFWFAECKLYFEQYFVRLDKRRIAMSPSEWAVFRLDCDYQEYFEHRIKSAERALIRKAIKNGFTVRQISYDDYLDDIIEINCSKSERGGRPMSNDYIHAEKWEQIVKPVNPYIYI